MSVKQPAEDEIRALVQAGQVDVATTLALRTYGNEILGFLSGVLGDDAGDEVFSAFSERLWRAIAKFKWSCTLRTWAYVLARHEISRFHRGERRHVDGRVPISEIQDALVAVRKTYSTQAVQRGRLVQLRDDLPVDDRTLLILRVDRNLSYHEIALAFAEDPEAISDEELKREAARLRQRFVLVKKRLIALASGAV